MELRTNHRRRIIKPDGYGVNTRQCGDTVEIFLVAHRDCIQDASYETNGCLETNACAYAVVEMVSGRRIDDVWQISATDVVDYLQTLATDHHHCAVLAVGALYRALVDLRKKQAKPWMKLYGVSRQDFMTDLFRNH